MDTRYEKFVVVVIRASVFFSSAFDSSSGFESYLDSNSLMSISADLSGVPWSVSFEASSFQDA